MVIIASCFWEEILFSTWDTRSNSFLNKCFKVVIWFKVKNNVSNNIHGAWIWQKIVDVDLNDWNLGDTTSKGTEKVPPPIHVPFELLSISVYCDTVDLTHPCGQVFPEGNDISWCQSSEVGSEIGTLQMGLPHPRKEFLCLSGPELLGSRSQSHWRAPEW